MGEWSHVAATFDGSTVRLYLNGVMEGSNTRAAIVPATHTEVPFSVGVGVQADGNSSLAPFPGFLSQVRFWRVARTTEQLKQGMIEGIPSDRSGLVANWILDEGIGALAKDTSGNGYDLRSRNAAAAPRWVLTDGKSLERVRSALHMISVSPDSAVQR